MSKLLTEQEIVKTTLDTLDAVPFGRTTKEEISSQYLKRAVLCTLRIRTAIAQLKMIHGAESSLALSRAIAGVIDGLSLALPEEFSK